MGNVEYSQSLLSGALIVLALTSLREEPAGTTPWLTPAGPQSSRAATSLPGPGAPYLRGEAPPPVPGFVRMKPHGSASQVLRPQTHRFLPVLKPRSRYPRHSSPGQTGCHSRIASALAEERRQPRTASARGLSHHRVPRVSETLTNRKGRQRLSKAPARLTLTPGHAAS